VTDSQKDQQANLFENPSISGATESFRKFCDSIGVVLEGNWADRFGDGLRDWARAAITRPVKTLSLFSGMGGLDIAFHDAGFSISHAVEIEERFAATLSANVGSGRYLEGTQVICGDIREFQPAKDYKVDFIIGGPPCQSFSAAGRRVAGVAGTQDERGVLFQEYVRLLKILQPSGFLFENVYGITGAEGGKAWAEIQMAFAAAGYTITSRILDAADYGVPQHRERMFIVGRREGLYLFPAPTHGPDSTDQLPFVSAAQAIANSTLSENERDFKLRGRYGHLLNEIPPGLNYSFFSEEMNHPNPIFAWRSKFSDFLYKAHPDFPIRTLKAQGGQYTGPFHWDNRAFGIAELKRLQTVPDSYEVNGKRQVAIHQIGNSVPPQIGRILAVSILSQVFGVVLPAGLPTLREGAQLGFRTRKRERTKIYRATAAAAMLTAKPAIAKENIQYEYEATLGDDFAWTRGRGPLRIKVEVEERTWIFEAVLPSSPATKRPLFEISLRGIPARNWALGDTTVLLKGFNGERDVFVGLWKAFEFELSKQGVKADLVQLCEYYQYAPRFHGRMIFHQNLGLKWAILGKIIEGIGTREIIDEFTLASLWGVSVDDILPLAVWLRSFGYEARNAHTNQQIPKGSYLYPYSFPTLTPLSVQLRKKMESRMLSEKDELAKPRLEVYKRHSVLVKEDGESQEFLEGEPSTEAKERLQRIKSELENNYLRNLIVSCRNLQSPIEAITEPHYQLLSKLVNSVTSEVGRAIVGIMVLQMCIKAIVPEQSIRLHKSGGGGDNFSWAEGIPMRVLDKNYITPTLREFGLLKLNADGFMMTRSLAENYPYSKLYKAAIRGARHEWLELVDLIEDRQLDAEMALKRLISMLFNRTTVFHATVQSTRTHLDQALAQIENLSDARRFVLSFIDAAPRSARLFEVATHSFFQVLHEAKIFGGSLKPLSQMRSANKKHGNVGDIEILTRAGGLAIEEAWDAKYGKSDLFDELEELNEKLQDHPETKKAGFVTNKKINLKNDIKARIEEINALHDISVEILSFDEWVEKQSVRLSRAHGTLHVDWLLAFAGCLFQERRTIAPIDEPCDEWVEWLGKYSQDWKK
jgi:DNA (cytosine-5)-methyltransferase 1